MLFSSIRSFCVAGGRRSPVPAAACLTLSFQHVLRNMGSFFSAVSTVLFNQRVWGSSA
jgi:hypothetical protein